MKLSDWASIAEVVGAVAVVMSLVYVGIQINGNTTEVREANRQVLVNRSFDATQQIAANSELAMILQKATDGQRLDAAEQTQYSYFVRGLLYDIQEGYLLHREGRLSDEYWDTRRATFAAYMSREPARVVYHRDRELGILQPSFVDWVDQQFAE